MSKKLKRSAVALVLAATMVFSSQGVLTAFAVGENETSTAVDVSALEPILDKEETVVVEGPSNTDETETPEVTEPCDKTEDCTLSKDHEGECQVAPVDPPAEDENGEGETQPCTKTEGCTLENGHEGECVTEPVTPPEEENGEDETQPCEKTEGCTLPNGHEGECVVEENTEDTEDTQEPSEEDVAAAKNVSDLIGALPEASTLNPETTDVEALTAQVKAAREAYDKLTDAQKALVEQTVLDKLVALEGALEALQNTNVADVNDVAKIGDTFYETLDAAIEAALKTDDSTITLLDNIEVSKVLQLSSQNNLTKITFDLGGHTWTSDPTGRTPQALTIVANNKGQTISIKNGTFRGPVLCMGGIVQFEDITFKEISVGNFPIISTGSGAELALTDVTFENNNGTNIVSANGKAELTNCTFSGNTATNGAVVSAAKGTTLTMNGVKFENNSGPRIVNVDGKAELSNCTFSGNTATSEAIVKIFMPADLPSSVTSCTFNNNSAASSALHVTGSSSGDTTTTISDCTFTENKGQNGGAIYVCAVVDIKDSTFTGNTALNGGAILVSGSAVDTDYKASITNCTITGNSAEQGISGSGGFGGGVSVQARGVATIDSSTVIHSNTADQAGADLHVREKLQASLTFSPVGENWKLADCGHEITGWYQDTEGNRWSEDSITEEVTFEGNTLTLTAAALKAAHDKIDTPVPPDPTPGEEQDWDHSKSKTATPLDANYESDVTLSLPSAEEQLVSDVVFVLDKSTSTDVTNQISSMLEDLSAQVEETGASVKVGIVSFNKAATRELELTDLVTGIETIQQKLSSLTQISGTNMHAGILAGKSMLDADTSVDASRKYLVFVTDGISYIYDEDSQIVPYYWMNDNSPYFSMDPYSWSFKYGNNNPPENWSELLNTIGSIMSTETIGTVSYDIRKDLTTSDGVNASELEKNTYTTTVDRSLYYTYEVYSEAQKAGYHCYAVNSETSAEYAWGPDFMNYLANGQEVSFEDIQNDIFYLLAEGSSVVDVIGYGKDDSESKNDYNFDFVNDIKTLSLTVGGKPLSVRELAPDGNGTSAYGFYDPNNASGDNDFVLRYYKNGQDGNSDECFVWEINVPVSNFAPVQLTYTVKLTNPQTVEGVYGKYDEDGSEGYTSLYTNKEATLYPVDSNGDNGVPENFPKPTVSYTVDNGNDNPGTDPTPDPDPDPDRPSRPNRDDDDDWEPLPDAPVKDKPTTEVDVPEGTETPTTEQPDKYNPETGDTTTVFAAMALAAVSLGGVVLLGRKKK